MFLRGSISIGVWVLAVASLYAVEHAHPKVRVPPDDLPGEERRAVRLYQDVLPTVVTISSSRPIFTPRGPLPESSAGSGVLISPDRHVLTAAHLIEGATRINVKTFDGKSRPAEIVYSEPEADIALIRLLKPAPELPHATLGDSDRLAVGQAVYVIGSPFGLENSFSVGHISGFREFGRLYDGTILAEFIQTDAAINSGNSGGPVFNSSGEVIGIASRILSRSGGSEGLGFVVAINTAKALLALEDRPWIGLQGIFLDKKALARLFNIEREGGLLVQSVTAGSPADVAGLRGGSVPARIFDRDILLGGDLIVELNTQPACHTQCLMQEGRHLTSLDRIPVKYLRGGMLMETTIDVSNSRRNFLDGPDAGGPGDG